MVGQLIMAENTTRDAGSRDCFIYAETFECQGRCFGNMSSDWCSKSANLWLYNALPCLHCVKFQHNAVVLGLIFLTLCLAAMARAFQGFSFSMLPKWQLVYNHFVSSFVAKHIGMTDESKIWPRTIGAGLSVVRYCAWLAMDWANHV